MLALLLAVLMAHALPAQTTPWKVSHVAIVLQHSGAQRSVGAAVMTMLKLLLNDKPEKVQVSLIGFDPKFQQIDNARFSRKPAVLESRTTDSDALKDVLANTPFQGPSPVYDAILQALGANRDEKPEMILLLSNGLDNASETDFDEMVKRVTEEQVPVVVVYLPATPPAGGDNRMKKLAKSSGGKFIDLRAKDCWDQLLAALR